MPARTLVHKLGFPVHEAMGFEVGKHLTFKFVRGFLQAKDVDSLFDQKLDVLKYQVFVMTVQNIVCRTRKVHANIVISILTEFAGYA